MVDQRIGGPGLLLLLLLSGCQPFQSAPEGEVAPAKPVVVPIVREGSGTFPASCSPTDVLAVVESFLTAFDRGDEKALAAQIDPGFQWYSATGPVGHVALYDLPSFSQYARERHEKAERLTLRELEVSNGSWHMMVDIVYRLERSADDFERVNMIGKGVVNCPAKTIYVWSMAAEGYQPAP